MTVTMNPTANGSRQRNSLASQIDRLDSMLDGLDKGLSGAITDAVKESVAAVVPETIRAIVLELATNPSVLTLLRGVVAPVVSQPAAAAAADPVPAAAAGPTPGVAKRRTLLRRIGHGIASACRAAVAKVKAVGRAIVSRTCRIRAGIVGSYRQINGMWRLRWPVAIALAVGAAAGFVACMSSPWVAGTLSGIGAAGATLGAQLAWWVRRLMTSFAVR